MGSGEGVNNLLHLLVRNESKWGCQVFRHLETYHPPGFVKEHLKGFLDLEVPLNLEFRQKGKNLEEEEKNNPTDLKSHDLETMLF